jgi:transposase
VSSCNNHQDNKNKSTLIKIPDKLWNKISCLLPKEKPHNTLGRPISSFRKVMDGIVYVLRTEDVSGKCYQENMVRNQPVIGNFSSGFRLTFSKDMDSVVENL